MREKGGLNDRAQAPSFEVQAARPGVRHSRRVLYHTPPPKKKHTYTHDEPDKCWQIITAHCKGQRMTTKPICQVVSHADVFSGLIFHLTEMKRQGVMRKRGRVNTAYQDRFFVLSRNGSLNYYEVRVSSAMYASCATTNLHVCP